MPKKKQDGEGKSKKSKKKGGNEQNENERRIYEELNEARKAEIEINVHYHPFSLIFSTYLLHLVSS